MTIAKASARKSQGEYKPIIEYLGEGYERTEVVEQSPERAGTHTKHGYIKGDKFARGTTYATRDEAVAAAQREIDWRLSRALADYYKRDSPKYRQYIGEQIVMWGGTVPTQETQN